MAAFPVLICGAGNVNFGTTEGPWNHTKRLESILGTRLKVVGLVDIRREAAQARIDAKLASPAAASWKTCNVYASIKDASAALHGADSPLLTLVGLPPFGRGSSVEGKDVDLQARLHFPNTAIFVEKPISWTDDFQNIRDVADKMKGATVSVGYMLRYLRAVQEMKRILQENKLNVMATMTTYFMAYEYAGSAHDRIAWWDSNEELGPIVSQGTHVCDLSRYLGGEVDLQSVSATTVNWDDAPGKLRLNFLAEETILPENRIPRVTSASWKYKSGAVGSLVHAVCLHDFDYEVEFVVIADGYRLKLVDPYGKPRLYVRAPGSPDETITRFDDDDPFETEMAVVIKAAEDPSHSKDILSSYIDAVQTYEFTWAIRLAGEKSMQKGGHVATL